MNKFKNQRKIISDNKMERMFAQALQDAGVAYITDKEWNTKNSLIACKIGNHIYARFPCKDQKANRLKCYNVRYSLDEPLDHICFIPYPSPVLSQVEF